MDARHQIFVIAVVLASAFSAFARVFVFDDGQSALEDQRMLASSQTTRGWRPRVFLDTKEPNHRPQDTPDTQVAATGERIRRDHHEGITGPVHTFVKTDKHAHFKWGVRHHVGHEFAG